MYFKNDNVLLTPHREKKLIVLTGSLLYVQTLKSEVLLSAVNIG